MEYFTANTLKDSLARLTADECKAAKITLCDLQLNPESPGLSFHRLDKAKDKNFWSVRVNDDIRIIVHRRPDSLLACYVDHHDKAYKWAERHKIETHPKTGSAQLVKIRETVQEIVIPKYVELEVERPARKTSAASPAKPTFERWSDDDLLDYGVPPEWLADVRKVWDDDSLQALCLHLPPDAAEYLLELACGGSPTKPEKLDATQVNPLKHPEAQRQFSLVTSVEELKTALEFPWDKWITYLHPDQRRLVERSYNGPARVAGSAGTGKTIVAVHRAVQLARKHPDALVLLTTYSDTLASALQEKIKKLVRGEPSLLDRIDIYSLQMVGLRLYKTQVGKIALAARLNVQELLAEAASQVKGHSFSPYFLRTEWEQVVDAWKLQTWEAYRDVQRLGRKTRLPEAKRQLLWSIFERVQAGLAQKGLTTPAAMFTTLAERLRESGRQVYDYAIVDEAQDASVAHIRFLAALGGGRPDALFFAGDLGQRIFQQPFSWKSLGVDVRGRSRTLRVNYRTSHQIRSQADRLLDGEVTDADGNVETRKGTVSVFSGPPPSMRGFESEADEIQAVGAWLAERLAEGFAPHEMAVFVRSEAQIERARNAVAAAGMSALVLDEKVSTVTGQVSVCTINLAKGLEFRAVAVMACDDEVIPLADRLLAATDDDELREAYDTERHLLYVACTRARDMLLLTGVEPTSEFWADMA